MQEGGSVRRDRKVVGLKDFPDFVLFDVQKNQEKKTKNQAKNNVVGFYVFFLIWSHFDFLKIVERRFKRLSY